MYIPRRDFLKYCIGAAAALGLENSVVRTLDEAFASGAGVSTPSYPIASTVYTTLQKTIVPLAHGAQALLPRQVSQYAANHYGEWNPNGAPAPYVRPNIQTGAAVPSVRDPGAVTLLTFFTMSDIHIADKESPAQCIYMGYQYPNPKTPGGASVGNSSAYSPVILYTTHVLDAAVQTINALHRTAPFDFGIALGDAANNNQYNELRWYLDVIDGKPIAPSSGAHLGAGTIDYQKPFQPAGLDKSIPWYQVIGNHDQFWMGSAHANTYVQNTYTGSNVLNLGPINSLPPDFPAIFNTRGFYMGVVNGSTRYGDIIDVGAVSGYPTPPQIAADANRPSAFHGGLDERIFEHHIDTGRARIHATNDRQQFRLATISIRRRTYRSRSSFSTIPTEPAGTRPQPSTPTASSGSSMNSMRAKPRGNS